VTGHSRFGVLRVMTVGGRQVDSEATVITEAFETAALPFFLGELTICPEARVGVTGRGHIR